MMLQYYECPIYESYSFRRDIENITEVLELGADNGWTVIDYGETEYYNSKHFVHCNSYLTDVKINDNGYIDVITYKEKERYYEN